MSEAEGVLLGELLAELTRAAGAHGAGAHAAGAPAPGAKAESAAAAARAEDRVGVLITRLADAGEARREGGDLATAVCVLSKEAAAVPPASAPGLLVVPEGTSWAAEHVGPIVEVPDPRLALAVLSARFAEEHLPDAGVHPLAAVHPTATLGEGVRVAAGAVIGAGALVGAGSSIGAGAVVGDGVRLGEGCRIFPNATLYPGTVLGARVRVHAGAVIGADGFGYAASARGAVKVHHLGGVVLQDDVEVGANACVDRGTLESTVVGARTKIDNLCQVGHNVVIGSDTLIAGMAGIAGSARIGSGVVLGGYVAVSDHVTIGDGARVAGRSGVTKDVPPGATWAGFPARPYREFVRELYLLGKLEELWRRARGGEKAE